MISTAGIKIAGHVKVWDPITKEIFVDDHNAINPETMSIVIANLLANNGNSHVYEMHFGNGGAIRSDVANITYKDAELNLESGIIANLFNPTYFKVVDDADDSNNWNPEINYVKTEHIYGLPYSDIVITCTLTEDEPTSGPIDSVGPGKKLVGVDEEDAGRLEFSEIGLKSKGTAGLNSGYLLSHIVFEPVTKTADRIIQVVYTLRISV